MPIPPSQIHAIDESQPSPAAAAQAYESVLKECVGSGAIEQASGESTIWLNHCAVVRQRGVKLMMPTFPGNSDSSGHSYFSRRISPRLSFLPPSHKLLSRTRCFFMHFFFALFAVRSMQVPHIPPSISFFLASDRMATWPLSSHPLLLESTAWVASITDSPKPPPNRITLTLPVLNAARCVAVVAAGGSKAPVVKQSVPTESFSPSSPPFPAGLVRPEGQLLWILDVAAGSDV